MTRGRKESDNVGRIADAGGSRGRGVRHAPPLARLGDASPKNKVHNPITVYCAEVTEMQKNQVVRRSAWIRLVGN